jgi:hypothetical protein
MTPAVYDFGLTVPAGVINPVAPTDPLVEIGRCILETEKDVIERQGVNNITPVIEDGDAANQDRYDINLGNCLVLMIKADSISERIHSRGPVNKASYGARSCKKPRSLGAGSRSVSFETASRPFCPDGVR